jgi:CheY-like chemotaxis protein
LRDGVAGNNAFHFARHRIGRDHYSVRIRDGIDAADIIKSRSNNPFVFLTAYADKKTFAQAKIFEPSEHISKPVDNKQMGAATELALNKHIAIGNPQVL